MKYNGFCSCVSIFGEKYSGKSYLMNSIIGVKEGVKLILKYIFHNNFLKFNINHDKENEHFCIYLYTEPYFYEKENLYIFFIDTSKLGEINPENFPQNSTLFSILNLISSFMMINCFGDMIPSNLKHMVYATSLHENISLVNEEKDSEYKNDYLPYYLPPILWVFRDYQPESIKICKFQQFQNFLNDQKTKNKIYNQIKQFIAELYKDIDFIMACKIPDSNANEEKQWRDFVITIRKKILQKISPKIINGIKFNCRMFSSFIHSVIEELNENCVPNINNALEYIIENECILGYNEAIDQYLNSLKVTFDNDELKSMFCLTNILKVKEF